MHYQQELTKASNILYHAKEGMQTRKKLMFFKNDFIYKFYSNKHNRSDKAYGFIKEEIFTIDF